MTTPHEYEPCSGGSVRCALRQLVRDLKDSWQVRAAPELQLRDYPVGRRV